jgi:ATP-dependent helicase/nuclease subunit A
MEMARDEVRVMTVHGAKGLEANTVILADTTTLPAGAHPPKLLELVDGAIVWAKGKAEDVEAMAAARQDALDAARDEYRRLLYVAMTRAAERLVVCGAQGDRKIPDGCWYQLVRDALEGECVSEEADDKNGTVLRYRKHEAPPATTMVAAKEPSPQSTSLPAWLGHSAPVESPALRTVTPSSAAEEDDRRAPAGAGVNAALLRGSLAHRLLQALPDIPPARRLAAALYYLTRAGDKLTAEEHETIAAQVLRVLDDPAFREAFQHGSRAEVPIVGKLTLGHETVRVSGQIDRLAVTESSVLICDFKTNRPAPRRIEDVPPAYVTQLALYRAVLAKLYPGRAVRAALLWTEVPDLMELSGTALDAALTRIKRV